jgi:hypothetical protein
MRTGSLREESWYSKILRRRLSGTIKLKTRKDEHLLSWAGTQVDRWKN